MYLRTLLLAWLAPMLLDNALGSEVWVSGISPKSCVTNRGDFLVALHGSGFYKEKPGGWVVKFTEVFSGNVNYGSGVYVSENKLSIRLPHGGLALGEYQVSIENTSSLEFILLRVVQQPVIASFSALGGTYKTNDRMATGGKVEIDIFGHYFFDSSDILVRFEDEQRGVALEQPGSFLALDGAPAVRVQLPAWPEPAGWKEGCLDPMKPVRSSTCVPDMEISMRLSLDAGNTFSERIKFVFGYVKPLKVAVVLGGAFNDGGWNFLLNEGRTYILEKYGALVDGLTIAENIVEGEFSRQENIGETIRTSVAVPEYINGTKNRYHDAFSLLKRYCDEEYDLVFTTSFGFMGQTKDVSSSYKPCGRPSKENPNPLHTTYFVNAIGYKTNSITATMSTKHYQMRYLTGMVAGGSLAAHATSSYHTLRGNKCVAYIAAMPLPDVQRGINAFTIGCKKMYADCIVKVLFTGSWGEHNTELKAAAFMFNVAQCDILAHHTNYETSLEYYKSRGGLSVGYNSDSGSSLGDSVLVSSMFNWGPVFSYFVSELLTDTWKAHEKEPELGGLAYLQEQYWPGIAENAVKFSPKFSPKVAPATRIAVGKEYEKLRQERGDKAFHHIFCGKYMMKRWVYRHAKPPDGTESPSGARAQGCGGQPEWKRLETAQLPNLAHFRTSSGEPVPLNATALEESFCLWGINFAGEALVKTAFPPNFSENDIFNDFFVDGVELMEHQQNSYGVIHTDTNHQCYTSYGVHGDRFYSPPKVYPKCDNTQWRVERGVCDANSGKTPIVYSWVDEQVKCGVETPDTVNEWNEILTPSVLPYVNESEGEYRYPNCDYISDQSSTGSWLKVFSIVGIAVTGVLWGYVLGQRDHKVIRASQIDILNLLCAGAFLLNATTLLLLNEPTPFLCALRKWAFHISLDITLAAVWAKIYRVYHLYNFPGKGKARITQTSVVMKSLILVFTDVVVLSLGTILYPPQIVTEPLSIPLPVQGVGKLEQTSCADIGREFVTASTLLKLIGSGVILYLVYRTRTCPSEFVEHKYIVLGVYNALSVGGLTGIYMMFGQPSYTTAAIMQAGVTMYCTIVLLALLIVPKLLTVYGYLSSGSISTGTQQSSHKIAPSSVETGKVPPPDGGSMVSQFPLPTGVSDTNIPIPESERSTMRGY